MLHHPKVKGANCLKTNVAEEGMVALEIMLRGEYMRGSSVIEDTEKMRSRYRGASSFEKSRLLEEFTSVRGYHRKTAARLLSGKDRPVVRRNAADLRNIGRR